MAPRRWEEYVLALVIVVIVAAILWQYVYSSDASNMRAVRLSDNPRFPSEADLSTYDRTLRDFNVSACMSLTNRTLENRCLRLVGERSGNTTICGMIRYSSKSKDDCFRNTAVKQRNGTICKMIGDPVKFTDCVNKTGG